MTELHRPATVTQVVELLAEHPGARLMGGGTTLVQRVHDGLRLAHVVSLERVDALWGVDVRPGCVVLGAATPLAVVLEHAGLDAAPMVREALAAIGSPQSRNRATLGGEVACQGELTTALLALDARVHIRSARGARVARVDALGLNPMELITHIEVPHHGTPWMYRRVAWRKALAPAHLVVAATVALQGGLVTEACVAVGGEGVLSFRLPVMEASVVGAPPQGQRARRLHNDVEWDDRLAPWRSRAAEKVLGAWLDDLG